MAMRLVFILLCSIFQNICDDNVDSFIAHACSCSDMFDANFFTNYSALHMAVKKGMLWGKVKIRSCMSFISTVYWEKKHIFKSVI